MKYYVDIFKNSIQNRFFDINGRSDKRELFVFLFFSCIIYLLCQIIVFLSHKNFLIVSLAAGINLLIYLLSFPIFVRRLHDINKSGWWVLLQFIPIFGIIILLLFSLYDSDDFINKYGPPYNYTNN